jgi:hypothetical protein
MSAPDHKSNLRYLKPIHAGLCSKKRFLLKLKDFIKKCKSANYCKVMKGLLEKIQENCNFIEDRRKPIQFSLKDKKSVVSVL